MTSESITLTNPITKDDLPSFDKIIIYVKAWNLGVTKTYKTILTPNQKYNRIFHQYFENGVDKYENKEMSRNDGLELINKEINNSLHVKEGHQNKYYRILDVKVVGYLKDNSSLRAKSTKISKSNFPKLNVEKMF